MNYVKEIIHHFEQIPPDYNAIRKLLSSRKFSKKELTQIAVACTDDCFSEYRDAIDENFKDFSESDMHSNYILDSISLLLEFGLDPNEIFEDENPMWNSMWIDAPNVGAAVLRLFLENGGNPNHCIPPDHETLFDYISFKVSYDEYFHDYFFTVQCWLVLMAYGGCWSDGMIPLIMLGDNSVEIFKNFELFDYEIEVLEQVAGRYGCWIMHIFNKESGEEVARYE